MVCLGLLSISSLKLSPPLNYQANNSLLFYFILLYFILLPFQVTKFLHKLEVPQGSNISAFQKLKFHVLHCGGVA